MKGPLFWENWGTLRTDPPPSLPQFQPPPLLKFTKRNLTIIKINLGRLKKDIMCSSAPASNLCMQPFIRCPQPVSCQQPFPCPCPSADPCDEKLQLFLFGSSVQALTGTPAPLKLIGAVGTQLGTWNPLTFSFTAPEDGTYLVNIQVYLETTAANDTVALTTTVNLITQTNLAGTTLLSAASTSATTASISGALSLKKDDVVQFLANQAVFVIGTSVNFEALPNIRTTSVSITQL